MRLTLPIASAFRHGDQTRPAVGESIRNSRDNAQREMNEIDGKNGVSA
jgi:hypothetical protein